MMLPRVNIDQLVDRIGNGRHERIYTLFRRPYGEMLCTRLLIENKIIKMKKYISIELLK